MIQSMVGSQLHCGESYTGCKHGERTWVVEDMSPVPSLSDGKPGYVLPLGWHSAKCVTKRNKRT